MKNVDGTFLSLSNRRAAGRASLVALTATLYATTATAQSEDRGAAPSLPEPTAEEDAPPSQSKLLEDRLDELTERLRKSEEARNAAPALTWNGYVDFGFFAPIGNHGAGWVRDVGNHQFPRFGPGGTEPYTWTFLGDILATTINSRGDVADLGEGSGIVRYDSVNSDGAPGFLVNELNLRPRYALSDNAILRASVNFAPRSGENFALGDTADVDLAEAEYLLTKDGKTSIFAGKILPVFGIEYKERKADQRFGITPSLIGRYTMGPQLGLKVRSKLLNDWLVLAGSVTNNSSTIEAFHFYSEVDKNWGKTLNGRAAVSVPVGDLWGGEDRLEIGLSYEWGPQDRATNNAGKMWFEGIDAQLLGVSYAIKAQIMRGGAPGRPEEGVYGLNLEPSGYVEGNWQILPILGVLGRFELRDAVVALGTDRLYITKERRYTAGVRVVLSPHIVAKAEYLHNQEYAGIKEFLNDVFTTSLVLAF
jgi:hypothetical protein